MLPIKRHFINTTNMRRSIIFILISTAFYAHGQYDQCIVEHTQSKGNCKPLHECPSVIEEIRYKFHHTRCGFAGKMEIVCCPESATIETGTPVKSYFSRISERKCDEYKSAVFEDVLSPYSLEEPPKNIAIDKCAHKSVPLILGYYPSPKEFPHMALIGFDSEDGKVGWRCGGSLISDEYILTAAHCLNARSLGDPKYVRLGEFNFSNNAEYLGPEDYNVSNIISHPEYERRSFYNDIGLVKLDRKVKLTPYKRPACLSTTFDNLENAVISTGWGRPDSSSELPSFEYNILKEFTSECNATYASDITYRFPQGIMSDTQICAILKDNIKSYDTDDSGGPLQIHHPNHYCMYKVIGVRTIATIIDSTILEIHAKVYHYIDWIESIVWKNDF